MEKASKGKENGGFRPGSIHLLKVEPLQKNKIFMPRCKAAKDRKEKIFAYPLRLGLEMTNELFHTPLHGIS